MVDNRSLRYKSELIKSLEDMQKKARKFKRLWKINGEDRSPIYHTASKELPFSNRLNLGVYPFNPNNKSKDEENFLYLSLGKSKAHPRESIFYSFYSFNLSPVERIKPRSEKEIYDFLKIFTNSDSASVISPLVSKIEKQFSEGIEKALAFEKEYKSLRTKK